MRRSPLSTLFALAWALVAASSAPGLALAHGEAHHELTEHFDRGHSHDVVADTHVELASHPEVESDGHHGNHAHLELAALLAKSRVDLNVGIITPIIDVPRASVQPLRSVSIDTRVGVRDGPPPDSPRQPRAPPLG